MVAAKLRAQRRTQLGNHTRPLRLVRQVHLVRRRIHTCPEVAGVIVKLEAVELRRRVPKRSEGGGVPLDPLQEENMVLFGVLFLCSSRACLGKMMLFTSKSGPKQCRFLTSVKRQRSSRREYPTVSYCIRGRSDRAQRSTALEAGMMDARHSVSQDRQTIRQTDSSVVCHTGGRQMRRVLRWLVGEQRAGGQLKGLT